MALVTSEIFVRAFLDAIEDGRLVGHEEDWYTPDAIRIEWPDRLAPAGATRDLVERQSYEIVNLVENGQQVAVEAIFRATFKVDLADLPKGEALEARLAMFLEMHAGRIRRHTSYDGFLPR